MWAGLKLKNNMEQQPIYLNNIAIALKMREAGFNKDCFFYAVLHQYTKRSILKFYHAYASEFSEFDAIHWEGNIFEDRLNLPTLGEIELPPTLMIRRDHDNTFTIYCVLMDDGHFLALWLKEIGVKNIFETELKARAHAWLWAKQNEKEGKNE